MPEGEASHSGNKLPMAPSDNGGGDCGGGAGGSTPQPPAPESPRPPPVDACAFCLDPLDAASLVLPCAHSFHSVCALQFLLKRKQCITCRAPVDETRVTDLAALPQASGRSFVQRPDGWAASPQPGGKAGGKADASPGRIELLAVAGRTAGAASPAAAGLGGAAAAAPAASPDGQQPVSRDHTWNSPLAAASLAATQSEGGGGGAAAGWLPDISLLSAPPRSPHAGDRALGSATPAAAAAAEAAVAAEEGRGQEPRQPIRTITVVRPQPSWVRPLFIGLLVFGLLAIIVVVPIVLGRSEPSTTWDRRTAAEVERDCWLCLLSDAARCPDCQLAWSTGAPVPAPR